jgi:2-iminobutanoate/2-iminopropanoate deaminase
MKKHLHTKNSPAAIGPYSQAVAIDNLVFLSGQIPLNKKGKMVKGTVEQKTQQIFTNIEAILMEGGGTLNDLVKLTVFLTSLDDFEVINKTMMSRLTRPYPARSCVEVSALPKGSTIEVEAIARIDSHTKLSN